MSTYLQLLIWCLTLIPAFQSQRNACGDKIGNRRVLSRGVGAIMPVQINQQLLSIQKGDDPHLSKLIISVRGQSYFSIDGGNSFVALKNKFCCYKYPTDLDFPNVCVQSSANPKIFYRPAKNGHHGSDIELSRDGGKSWKAIHPKTSSGRYFGSIRIVGSSEHVPGRVYAIGSTVGENGAYVSEDYGETYRQIRPISAFVFESRSMSKTLYSVAVDGIIVSYDGGYKWNLIGNTKEMISPVYSDSGGYSLYTWSDHNHNRELELHPKIIQIETDANNGNAIYILSYKGLYRSFDGGISFQLLPLAKDKIGEIQAIAVDPIDGRFLYAAVGNNSLLKSSNYGCSWQELSLPKWTD
jgi:hypothetical protein